MRFRVAGRPKRIHVHANGRDVTQRIRALPSGRYSVLLGSRHLRAKGSNDVAVSARFAGGRHDFQRVRFVAGARDPALVRVLAPGHGHVRVAGAIPVSLRLASEPDRLVLRLNGRRVRYRPTHTAGLVHDLEVAAHHGLRHGRNVLEVVAYRRDGDYDVERRAFHVRRSGPLPSAGHDLVATVGTHVRLDASASRPVRARLPLGFRWRIAESPAGSRPRLLRPTAARPLLRADVPGHYRLEVAVSHARGRRALRRAVAITTDSTTASVRPSVTPQGIPIKTLVTRDGKLGIEVGDKFIPSPDSNKVQWVSLDRTTLEVKINTAFSGKLDAGMPETYATSPEYLTIVSGRCCTNSGLGWASNSGFTYAGSVNPAWFTEGIASRNLPTTGISAFNPYGIDALLRLTPDRRRFRLVSRDYVPFNTWSSDSNTLGVQVGGTRYAFPGLAVGGRYKTSRPTFLVVTLDAGLKPLHGTGWRQYFVDNRGNADPQLDVQEQRAMAQDLKDAASRLGTLVIVQSFGHPKATTSAWNDIADQIEKLGGTRAAFLGMDGSGEYTLVGGPAARGLETTSASANGGSSLSGMLGRTSWWQYAPVMGSPAPGGDFSDQSLLRVANARPVEWPASQTDGQRKAMAYIAGALGIKASKDGDGNCYPTKTADVRAAYCNLNVPWGSKEAKLELLACADGDGYKASDCEDVKRTLLDEIDWVGTVANMIDNLQKPLGWSTTSGSVHFDQIAHSIENALGSGGDNQAEATELGLLSDFLGAGWAVASESVAPVVGLLSEALAVASTLDSDSDSAAPAATFSGRAADIGDRLSEHYVSASMRLGDVGEVLVSDYAKLKDAADKALNGPWRIDYQKIDVMKTGLSRAGTRSLWQALMPSAYRAVMIHNDGTPAGELTCKPQRFGHGPVYSTPYKVFPNIPDSAWFTPVSSIDDAGAQHRDWLLGLAARDGSGPPNEHGFTVPPASITDPLFKAASDGGVGLVKPLAFNRFPIERREDRCRAP